VSLLTGSEPVAAGTVIDAYRVATPVIALVLLVAAVLAVRPPPRRPRVRQQIAVATATAVAGGVLLVFPTLALGWRQNWLWAPDLTALAAIAGTAFIVAAVRRLRAVRTSRHRTEVEPLTTDPPIPLEAAR
jgi:peptidoglycan/LPS O-acetylase OafA/YrhL